MCVSSDIFEPMVADTREDMSGVDGIRNAPYIYFPSKAATL